MTRSFWTNLKTVFERRTPAVLFALGLLVYFSRLLTSPPGINPDSARAGLYTLDFLYRNVWPFYIYQHFAPTPLLIYLQAPIFPVFGFTLPALRGVTAFANALSVPALYIACRELLAGLDRRLANRAGWLAALGVLAFPYWTMFARHGLEGTLMPLMELLVVATLWRGLRRGRRIDFALAGFVLGLSQYIYIVARAFPVAIGVACLAALITDRQLWSRWRGLMLAAGIASLIPLPQWLLFLDAPYTFSARLGESAGQLIFGVPDTVRVFLEKLVNQLLVFGVRWETGYNLYSTRPWLTPMLFVGFIIAIVWGIRAKLGGLRFVLAAFGIMLVPDLLTYEGTAPSASRLMGAIHFAFLIAGIGCAWLWRWIETQPRLPRFSRYLVLAAVILFGLEAEWDFATNVIPKVNAYPGLEWRAGLIEQAEADFILRNSGDPILIPTSEYTRASLAFLLADRFPARHGAAEPPLTPGETVTVLGPVDPERATTEGIPAGFIADEWVLLKDGAAYFLPPLKNSLGYYGGSSEIYASNGVLAAVATRAQWFPVEPDVAPVSASFVYGLDLTGYTVAYFAPGQSVTVTLYWLPRQRIERDVQLFVQILDRNGEAIASIHDWPLHGAYRVRAWQAGETVPLSYRLNIPAETPPGPYRLVAKVWDLAYQRRVELVSGGDVATVAGLKIPLPPPSAQPAQVLDARLGDSIRLAGYTLDSAAGGLKLTLYWRASAAPDFDYTVFVHLVDAAGNIAAQADAQPRDGEYPASIWTASEIVEDERFVPAPPGEYQVFVGMYRWDTGERLPAAVDGERVLDDRVDLGRVSVP